MKPQIVLLVPLGDAPAGAYPDQGLPGQPPRPWNPAFPTNPIAPGGQPGYPSQGLPGQQPGYPDQGLPPLPPGVQPPSGGHPSHPIVIPGTPEHPIALPPGTIWPPIQPPPGAGSGEEADKMVVLAWIPEQGYRYVVVDLSLKPDQGLPGGVPHPDQGLPPNQPAMPAPHQSPPRRR